MYSMARSAICRLPGSVSFAVIPYACKNLSRKGSGEINWQSKSSFRRIFSSMSFSFCFPSWNLCYSKTRLMMRLKDGDIGCSSFAAMRTQVAASVIRQGAGSYLTVSWAKYLSARLRARKIVSILYSRRTTSYSISLTIYCLAKGVIPNLAGTLK